jgi:hypothetical protein
MAGKATPPKPQPAGWGDDNNAASVVDGLKAAQKPVLPLTGNEIAGLREVLKRHGFDSEKGTF